jgi:hypothetical protein
MGHEQGFARPSMDHPAIKLGRRKLLRLGLLVPPSLLVACAPIALSAAHTGSPHKPEANGAEVAAKPSQMSDGPLKTSVQLPEGELENERVVFIEKPVQYGIPAEINEYPKYQEASFEAEDLGVYAYVKASSPANPADLGEFSHQYQVQGVIPVHTRPDVASPKIDLVPDELNKPGVRVALAYGKSYQVAVGMPCRSFLTYPARLANTDLKAEGFGGLWWAVFTLENPSRPIFALASNVALLSGDAVNAQFAGRGAYNQINLDRMKAPKCR